MERGADGSASAGLGLALGSCIEEANPASEGHTPRGSAIETAEGTGSSFEGRKNGDFFRLKLADLAKLGWIGPSDLGGTRYSIRNHQHSSTDSKSITPHGVHQNRIRKSVRWSGSIEYEILTRPGPSMVDSDLGFSCGRLGAYPGEGAASLVFGPYSTCTRWQSPERVKGES